MNASYKPNNYTSVSPYLIVNGASGTIDFLKRVFGAVELRRFPDAAGKIMHAEVRIDDTVVMIADGAEGWPPVPSYVHIYVADVDTTYKRALEAGAASVTNLKDYNKGLDLMNSSDIAPARLSNQLLGKRKYKTPGEVVAWLGAVQAQDFAAAKWALGLRMHEATDADIEKAFTGGAILRTHVMRPTWHFVVPQDICSLLTLTAPRVHAANAHMYRKLELDDDLLSRCHAVFTKALRGKEFLTRTELADRLTENRIKAAGLRLAYMIMHAELEALICSGPRRGKQFTYALLEERAPQTKKLRRDEALAQWTLRYFAGHGPAQLKDFAWWSGLTLQDAQQGLDLAAPQLAQEIIDGNTYWFSPNTKTVKPKAPAALFLSIYDEYTIAYKDRSALGGEQYSEKLLAMGNALTSVLILDGKIAGTWKRVVNKGRVEITMNPFRPLRKDEHEAIKAAATRYGEFLEMPCVLS